MTDYEHVSILGAALVREAGLGGASRQKALVLNANLSVVMKNKEICPPI